MLPSLGWAAQSQLGQSSLVLEGAEHCQQTQPEASKREASKGQPSKACSPMSCEAGLHQLSWPTRRVSLEVLGSWQCFLLPAQSSWARLHGLLKNLKCSSLFVKELKERLHTQLRQIQAVLTVIIWEDPCVQEVLVSRFFPDSFIAPEMRWEFRVFFSSTFSKDS